MAGSSQWAAGVTTAADEPAFIESSSKRQPAQQRGWKGNNRHSQQQQPPAQSPLDVQRDEKAGGSASLKLVTNCQASPNVANADPAMSEAHFRGECNPCAYFWHKADGCRWGDHCSFCHLCDSDAVKRWKKAKKLRKKAEAAEQNAATNDQLRVGSDKQAATSQTEAARPAAASASDFFRPAADEPARVDLPLEVELNMPDVAGVSRPYLPLELLLKLKPPGLEAPDVPDGNLELAIAKLGHGVLSPQAPSATVAAVNSESAEPQEAAAVASGAASSSQPQILRFADMFPALEQRPEELPPAWKAASAGLDLGEPQKVEPRLGMHFNRVQYWGPSLAWQESSASRDQRPEA